VGVQVNQQQRPDLSDNPFLRIENPWDEVKQSESKMQEEAKEFQRLCYSVFHEYADGKRLWEKLSSMYFMQQNLDPSQTNARNLSLWWDGFKAALLGMYNMGLMHQKRISGVNE
jgi:hypothetical protein